jgi:hypothetical protein
VLRSQQSEKSEVRNRLSSFDAAAHLRAMSYRQALRSAGSDEGRLRLVARARGYKAGWVWHRLQELRQGAA